MPFKYLKSKKKKKKTQKGKSSSANAIKATMKGPPFSLVTADHNILADLYDVPDGQLNRKHRDYLEDVTNTTQKVGWVQECCKHLVSVSDYLKTLKDLYERTGEEPSSTFMYYFERMYPLRNVNKIQQSERQQDTERRWQRGHSIPTQHVERMDAEIVRLQRIARDQVTANIKQFSEHCQLRLEMLTDVSDWLHGQHSILYDHLGPLSEWCIVEEVDELSLYTRLQNFMEYLEQAVNQIRRLSFQLFGLGFEPESQKKGKKSAKLGMVRLAQNQVPMAGAMLKNRDKISWSIKKISDILRFCNQMTNNTNTKKTLECGLELFSNMMAVIDQTFDKMDCTHENMLGLHKKVAVACNELEEGTDKLIELTKEQETLTVKHQGLIQKLSKLQVENEVLETKLKNVATSLTEMYEMQATLSGAPLSNTGHKSLDELEARTSAIGELNSLSETKVELSTSETKKMVQAEKDLEFYKDVLCYLKSKIDKLRKYAIKLEEKIKSLGFSKRHSTVSLDETTQKAMETAANILKERRTAGIEPPTDLPTDFPQFESLASDSPVQNLKMIHSFSSHRRKKAGAVQTPVSATAPSLSVKIPSTELREPLVPEWAPLIIPKTSGKGSRRSASLEDSRVISSSSSSGSTVEARVSKARSLHAERAQQALKKASELKADILKVTGEKAEGKCTIKMTAEPNAVDFETTLGYRTDVVWDTAVQMTTEPKAEVVETTSGYRTDVVLDTAAQMTAKPKSADFETMPEYETDVLDTAAQAIEKDSLKRTAKTKDTPKTFSEYKTGMIKTPSEPGTEGTLKTTKRTRRMDTSKMTVEPAEHEREVCQTSMQSETAVQPAKDETEISENITKHTLMAVEAETNVIKTPKHVFKSSARTKKTGRLKTTAKSVDTSKVEAEHKTESEEALGKHTAEAEHKTESEKALEKHTAEAEHKTESEKALEKHTAEAEHKTESEKALEKHTIKLTMESEKVSCISLTKDDKTKTEDMEREESSKEAKVIPSVCIGSVGGTAKQIKKEHLDIEEKTLSQSQDELKLTISRSISAGSIDVGHSTSAICVETQQSQEPVSAPLLEDKESSSTQWSEESYLRTVFFNILNQFLSLGLKLSDTFDKYDLKILADCVRQAHDSLDALINSEQYDVLKGLAQAVETYFKHIKSLIQRALSGVGRESAEAKIIRMRQDKIQEINQKATALQTKQSLLEKQFRSLWFMHLGLCQTVLKKRQNRLYAYVHEEMAFNETPVTVAEDTLKLPKGIVENNLKVLVEAFEQKKISQKCWDKGQECLRALDHIYNGHLPFLVRLFMIGQRLAEIDQLTSDQCKEHANEPVRCQKWRSWCKTRRARWRWRFQDTLTELNKWRKEKPRIIFRAWFLFNQIFQETGVGLTLPQPHVTSIAEPSRSHFVKIARELSKKRSVPIVNPDNYQKLVSAGKLPSSYIKRPLLIGGSDHSLSLDTRRSVTNAMVPQGFAPPPDNTKRRRRLKPNTFST